MSSDEDLIAQMSLQEESPDDPRQRRAQTQQFARSTFNADDLKAKHGARVWVKCISVLGPWADDKQLKFWKDYLVTVDDAIMLEERRFAVLLITPEDAVATQPEEQKQKPTQTLKIKAKQGE